MEAVVPKQFIGMTIGKADFINSYKVLVLSIIKERTADGLPNVAKEASGIATAHTVVR